jgi:exodeoxyribonuclease V alpha subunit
MIKGIGPNCGTDRGAVQGRTFTIIEQNPERLLEVSGIGRDRTGKIRAAWQEQKQVKEIMVFLHGHGVSTNLAVKIYKTYGDKSLETVQQNPYQLERDIYGVGFNRRPHRASAWTSSGSSFPHRSRHRICLE